MRKRWRSIVLPVGGSPPDVHGGGSVGSTVVIDSVLTRRYLIPSMGRRDGNVFPHRQARSDEAFKEVWSFPGQGVILRGGSGWQSAYRRSLMTNVAMGQCLIITI